jgi:hypothetical protein
MRSERGCCAVVALDARRILVVGGQDNDGALASTELLDLGTMAFTPGPTMRSLRFACAAVRLDAHRCLVVGGKNEDVEEDEEDEEDNYLSSTEVLDIATMTFTAGPELGTAQHGCSAVPLDSRHIFLVGGMGAHYKGPTSTDVSLFS